MSPLFKDKLRDMVQKNLNVEEILKNLCPFEFELKIRVLANTTYRKKKHDYAVLLMMTGDEQLVDDPRDMEAFIAQVTAQRPSLEWDLTIDTVAYDEEVYTTIFLDKKEAKKP